LITHYHALTPILHRFQKYVMLAGAVLPVWRKVEQVLASGEVSLLLRQADRRLPIVRAVERADAYAETCRRCGKEESRYY
jgi:hypothetical protein